MQIPLPEAAERSAVPLSTLRGWIRSGRLAAIKDIHAYSDGHALRFKWLVEEADIERSIGRPLKPSPQALRARLLILEQHIDGITEYLERGDIAGARREIEFARLTLRHLRQQVDEHLDARNTIGGG